MRIIDAYIGKTILKAIGLITLMLTGLQIFIQFVNQLPDLGRGDYGFLEGMFFVLLQLPYQVYLFFPMASLLGSLMGLGLLANNSELVVLQAAGMSIGQITGAVLKAAMLLIVLVTALVETVVPYVSHYANEYKWSSINGGQGLHTAGGIWLHYGGDFIFIGSILPDNILQNVVQFRFDESSQLQLARLIPQIKNSDSQWVAFDSKQTEFESDHTRVKNIPFSPWDVPVKPSLLKIGDSEPDAMTLHELGLYVREQNSTQQNFHRYILSFLQRLMQPVTTMVMMLLAIPFIFGPLRGSTMGSKFLVGATIGFGFYILNNLVGPVSLVFQWPPALAAFGPTLLFALMGIYLMRRVR